MEQIILTKTQSEAVEKIVAFLKTSEDSFFTLKGSAGTGKTTVINHVIKAANNPDIIVTAPTNKAVNVIRAMAQKTNLSFRSMTIHSYLGIKSVVRHDAKTDTYVEKFEPVYNAKPGNFGDFVIVDEASMIDAKLFKMIEQNADFSGLKFVFIGDPAQLPPINETHSKAFDVENSFTLTEIVRVDESNPVIEFLTAIRNNLKTERQLFPRINKINEHGGVKFYNTIVDFQAAIKSAFLTAKESGDVRSVKALAWTNNRVKSMNGFIRSVLYGEINDAYIIGELLIANAPVKAIIDGRETIIIQNSEEMYLSDFKKTKVEEDFDAYTLTVMLQDGRTEYVQVIAEEDLPDWKKYLKRLYAEASAKTGDEKRRAFAQYFKTVNLVADISFAYALTVHKSQGSTFDQVFVREDDIDYNKRIVERNQCRYVAYSRASKLVHVYNK